MQISTAIIFITSLVLAANAQPEEKGILRVPISRQSRPDPIISSIQKRNAELTKRDPFTASLYNDLGSQYLIDISIGTPAQNFSVTLDTGSADLWVPGSSCPTTECPNGLFSESSSSTFKSLSEAFTLVYGIGSVNGTYATDTVSISGATVQNQQFGLASDTQQILTNPNTITVSQTEKKSSVANNIKKLATSSSTPVANGILGLGYPKLTAASSKGQGVYNPFVFNLATQNIIANPIFSIYMNNAKKTGWVGEIIFGGVDNTKFTGNLTYMPVVSLTSTRSKKRALTISNSNYYWMVGAQGVAVTDTSGNSSSSNVNLSFSSTSAFILDTGTTLTYLPTNMAQQVVEAIAGTGNYQVDAGSGTYLVSCDAAKSTTSFVLQMTSSSSSSPITLSVPASQLVIPLDGTSTSSSSVCIFGIAPTTGSVGSNLYLIGDSILRSAYMVFDMANNRVGIASAVGVDGSVQGVSSDNTSAGVTLSPTMLAFVSCLVMAVLAF